MNTDVEILKSNVADLERQLRNVSERYLAVLSSNKVTVASLIVNADGSSKTTLSSPLSEGKYSVVIIKENALE